MPKLRASHLRFVLPACGVLFGGWILIFRPFGAEKRVLDSPLSVPFYLYDRIQPAPIIVDNETVSGNGAEGPIQAVERNSSLLEMSCKFPIIVPMERDLLGYVHLFRDVLCEKRMPNLASLSFDGQRLTIHNELEPYRQVKVPAFKCTYQGIEGGLFPNISEITWVSDEIEVAEDVEVDVPFDQFVVRCRDQTLVSVINGQEQRNNTLIYERAFAGFAKPKSEAPSLAMLVLDSVARNQFLRHAPRSADFMRRLGFEWLNGYVKVGDNSAVNLLPVLAGKSLLPQVGGDGSELIPNGTIVDLERTRFLWDIMKDRNCVTLFNDNILDPRRGLFYYPAEEFRGFRRPPADFYFRAYHLYNPRRMFYPAPTGGQCLKTGQMTSNEYLDIWEKFSTEFRHKCHFSFNFLTELAHDESSNLGSIDNRLRTSLERLFANGVLETTALVIMGDHGNRIADIQRSYAGRIEERAPLFALYVPPQFRRKFPGKWANFRWNVNRLTSNFDIHQTLSALLEPSSKTVGGRGINLFEKRVPVSRTCEEAGVPENFCLCMERRNLSRLDRRSKEFMAINEFIGNYTRSLKCLVQDKFHLAEDHLKPMAVNQMVRHGLRDAAGYEKKKEVQAALEIFFFDVLVNVQLRKSYYNSISGASKNIRLLCRIKHYLNVFTFELADAPLFYNENGEIAAEIAAKCLQNK